MSSTIAVRITGDPASYVKATLESSAATTEAADHMEKTSSGLASRTGGMFSKLGNTLGNFGVPFSGSLSTVGSKLEETEGKTSKFGNVLSKVAGVGFLPMVAGAAAVGAEAVKMGMALQDSQHQMDTAIKASGENVGKWQGQISETQNKMESWGFSNVQVDQALGQSVVSTQNMKTSLSEMSTAADLARFKHIDLASATDMLDKALTGNLRPLKQLGIDLPLQATNALKLKTASEALKGAQAAQYSILEKFPDAMNATSKAHTQYVTAVNHTAAAENNLAQLQQVHGQILDALSKRLGGQAADAANTFQGKIEVLKTQAEDLGGKLGTVLIPILEKLMTAVEGCIGWFEKHKQVAIALGVAVLALVSPIALVAIAAYELYDHWKAIWGDIKAVADDAWHFIDGILHNKIFNVIVALVMPIAFLGMHWRTTWNDIKAVVQDVWNFLKPIFDKIGAGVSSIVNGIGKAASIGKSVLTLGGLLAEGGPAQAGTPYIVGEAGPEIFVPGVSGVVVPNSAIANSQGAGGTAGSAGGSGSTTVELLIDGQKFASAIMDDFRAVAYRTKRKTVTLDMS